MARLIEGLIRFGVWLRWLAFRLNRLVSWLNGRSFWEWLPIVIALAAFGAGWLFFEAGWPRWLFEAGWPRWLFEAGWPRWLTILLFAGFLTIWLGPRLEPVVDLFLPMWMPVLVLLVAAYALFLTDQGRDLGVGLLDAGPGQLFLLAAALFYWALATWHAARLGLTRAFGASRDEWEGRYKEKVGYSTIWLRWLPRLLGACAHLYATFTIALAAQYVVPGFTWFELIYITPSLLIVAGTWAVWLHDKRCMAARDSRAGIDKDVAQRRRTRALVWLLCFVAVVVVTLVVAWWRDLLERGFVLATSYVLVSALLFLLLTTHRASSGEFLLRFIPEHQKRRVKYAFKETQKKPAISSWLLSFILMVIAGALIVPAWINPLPLGNALGSMVLAFTAFGVYIAIVNGVRIMARSSRTFVGIGAFALLLATGTSIVRDFHVVRLCGDSDTCTSAKDGTSAKDAINERATVGEAAIAWYNQAVDLDQPVDRYEQARQDVVVDQPVPMLIVATAGGGIRAAYWTATILEKLEQELPPEILRRHLFAISGVSGGSVGAAAYVAAVSSAPDTPAKPTDFLNEDFLAPAIATLAFVDLPSTILPDIGQIDRATALELAFEDASKVEDAGKVEDASKGLLALPFLDFFPRAADLSKEPWRPALLFNSTHQNTGRRVITSHLKVQPLVFLDAFDAHNLLGADMPASTAAHNSARFTYVSPAGRLLPRGDDGSTGDPQGFLLDGGYFENYGAVTALQVLREALAAIDEYRAEGKGLPEVRPVVLQISSDPSLRERDRARINGGTGGICASDADYIKFDYSEAKSWLGRLGPWEERDSGGRFAPLNELVAPLAGIIASRPAHGVLASAELARAICADRQLEIRPEDSKPQEDGHPVADVPMPRGVTSAIENPLVAIKGEPEISTEAAASASSNPRPSPPQAPPVYAHLAMCEGEEAKLSTDERAIEPPLGWVLSSRMRSGFGALLDAHCGNSEDLKYLVEALKSPQSPNPAPAANP